MGGTATTLSRADRPQVPWLAVHTVLDPFDLASLFAMRGLLDGLDPSAAPRLATLTARHPARTVALLPGSFNPPTAAHVLLAERALSEGYDLVAFVLARSTAGKTQTGLIREDRWLAMRAAGGSRIAAAVCSHGLYAEQAEAAAAAFPGAEITFLLGSDKVRQIFDDRWYADREASLERLFSQARLVAAPRGSDDDELEAVLETSEARPYAHRIEVMRLHPAVSDLSSTRVRGLLRSGADPAGLVPVDVAPLLAATRAFAPPLVIGDEEVDAYDVRSRVIDLLWQEREQVGAVDVRHLMRIALSRTEPGRRFRAMLAAGDGRAQDVARVRNVAV